jgi:hypothetical protein
VVVSVLLKDPNTLFLASTSGLGLLGTAVLLGTVLAFLALLASSSGSISQTMLLKKEEKKIR